MAVAMDSSCRHCYGAFRSMLKILGYSGECYPRIGRESCRRGIDCQGASGSGVRTQGLPVCTAPGSERPERIEGRGFSQLEIAEIAYLAGCQCRRQPAGYTAGCAARPARGNRRKLVRKVETTRSREKNSERRFLTLLTCLILQDSSVPVRALSGRWQARRQVPRLRRFSTARGIPRITSRRVKALIFAVIARGLGCPACEAEASEALRAEGWTDPEVQHVLTHLTSNKLRRLRARKVLSFARRPFAIRPGDCKSSRQAFAKGLKREVLLEVVGWVSYANGSGPHEHLAPSILIRPRALIVLRGALS